MLSQLISPAIDATSLIGRRASARYYVIVLLCTLLAMVEGFDSQIVAFAAPRMARDFGVDATSFGPVFASSMVGALLSVFAQGSAGDKLGRKTIVILSFILIGFATAATPVLHSWRALLVLRFAVGVGLGAALPNLFSIASEYAPIDKKYLYVTVIFTGFPLGAVLGGIASAEILSSFGWQPLFLLCGGATLALCVPTARLLPESLSFLAQLPERHQALRQVLRQLRIDVKPDATFIGPGHSSNLATSESSLSVGQLFTEGRGPGTALLWLVSFLSLLVSVSIINWLPTMLTKAGATIGAAVMASVVMNGGGIVGSLILSSLVGRQGYRPMITGYLLGAAALFAIGSLPVSGNGVTLFIFLAGVCFVGGQMCLASLTAYHYPPRLRAKGIGWAIGMGRIGGIVGTMLGGVLLARHLSVETVFSGCAVIVVVAAGTLVLAERSRHQARI